MTYIYLRHAERADLARRPLNRFPSKKTNAYNFMEVDPLLTARGHEQSQVTGLVLQKFMAAKNLGKESIVVKSSPFLRTLLTATRIAEVLGVSTVHIDFSLSEFLSKKAFKESPLETLEVIQAINSDKQAEFKQKYQISSTIRYVVDESDKPVHPEKRKVAL